MKMAKRVFSLVMVVVTLVSFMGIAAEAASVTTKKLNLGYMVPIDAKGTKTIETVKLYGDYDYINFYINSKKSDSFFTYEIYSDKNYTKLVEGDVVACDATGTYTFTPKIKLKGKYESKTYYMITYAVKVYSDGSISIDKNSTREFKVVVKRTASFGDKVVMLKEAKNTTKGVNVSWSKLSGASKYYIYRRNLTGTKWTKVGATGSSKTSFTDTSAKNKGKYVYTVKGISKSGKASRYLYFGLTIIFAKAPVMETLAAGPDNTIKIKWNSDSSRTKYTIMRKVNNGSWKVIKTDHRGTSYTDKSVKSGNKYTYTVKSFVSTDYGMATSSYYLNSDKTVTYLRMPTLKEAVAVKKGINVSWYTVSGAKGYTILRKNSDGSTGWSSVGKVGADATSFVDTSADTKINYIYTVRSEASKNKGSYNSIGLEYAFIDKPVVTVRDLLDDNKVEVSWNEISGATAYQIYYRKVDGEWVLLKTISSDYTSYTYTLNKVGVFEYKVRAVRKNKFFSEYSDVVAYTHNPTVFYDAVSFSDGIELGWRKYGFEGYNIYRKLYDAPDEAYVLIGTVSKNTFKDTTAQNDVAYQYMVIPVHNGEEQRENVITATAGILTKEQPSEIPPIKVSYDTLYKQTTDVMYGYNFKNGCWEKINDKLTRKSYKAYLNDGKYRFAFSCDDGLGKKTPIDNSIIDYEWYDKKVDFTIKLKEAYVIDLTINNVPEEIEEYEIRVGTQEVTIKTDGSDSYTCEIGYFCNTVTKLAGIGIHAKTKNGDVCVTTDKFYCMSTPEITAIQRQSNGDVKMNIKQGNYDDLGWDGYYIYRKVYGASEYEQIAVLDRPATKRYENKTTYTDTTAKKGVKYVYLIKSFKVYEGKTYVSYYDKKTIK